MLKCAGIVLLSVSALASDDLDLVQTNMARRGEDGQPKDDSDLEVPEEDPDRTPGETELGMESRCTAKERKGSIGLCRDCLQGFLQNLTEITLSDDFMGRITVHEDRLKQIHTISFKYQLVSYTLRCSTSALFPQCLPIAFAKDNFGSRCGDTSLSLVEHRDIAAMEKIGWRKEYDATILADFRASGGLSSEAKEAAGMLGGQQKEVSRTLAGSQEHVAEYDQKLAVESAKAEALSLKATVLAEWARAQQEAAEEVDSELVEDDFLEKDDRAGPMRWDCG